METEKNALLEKAIEDAFKDLESVEAGSKESAIVADNITKLYRVKLEEERNQLEWDDRYAKTLADEHKYKLETEQKQKTEDTRAKADWKKFLLDLAVKIGMGVGTFAFCRWQFATGMIFEKENTYRSATMRDIKNLTKPKLL